jgi:hypothetical protein
MGVLKRRFVNAVWRTWVGLKRPTRRQNLRRMLKRGESLDSLIIRKATRLIYRRWRAFMSKRGTPRMHRTG